MAEQRRTATRAMTQARRRHGRPARRAACPQRRTAQPKAIPPAWQRWIAEVKMLGTSDEQILAILEHNGMTAALGREELCRLESLPAYGAGERVAQRLKKLESILAMQRALSVLSPDHDVVERRSHVSSEEFLQRYYAANRPVILTNLFEVMPALACWTPDFLKRACGRAEVEVMTGRDADPDYEINCESHKTRIQFADYVDWVTTGALGNDRYLVANNGFFKQADTAALRESLVSMPPYLTPQDLGDHAFLWLGPSGTVTPLHHDVMNVLLAQVHGRKRFALIPPTEIGALYNHVGVYSQVDFEAPDLSRFPRFASVKALTVTLEPGELLFIPVGWFHHVRALEVSISVSFTNFVYPNDYDWSHPAKPR
jgi:hypothetical protein